jgi:hypothetical protein
LEVLKIEESRVGAFVYRLHSSAGSDRIMYTGQSKNMITRLIINWHMCIKYTVCLATPQITNTQAHMGHEM